MHPNPRRAAPIVVLLALAAGAGWYFLARPATADEGALVASGTIEAVRVRISPEIGGRVVAVYVDEGEAVRAGEALVELDTAALQAQRAQAQANLAALQAAHQAALAAYAAANANYDLLLAGPTKEQLAVAHTVVERAELAAEAAQEAYDALPEAARDTPDGQALRQQWEMAEANLANALAQYDLAAAGARPEQLAAAEAQVAAAEAQAAAAASQAAAAQAALEALDIQMAKHTLSAPAEGVVLARAIQPGEVASPGATLLELGRLADLSIIVYVPEDRYGAIRLGQPAQVTVDSFPGEAFSAKVVHVADEAEFTPRNVQTAEGRKTTVFAVRLAIHDPQGRLRPGMPADVRFGD